MIPLKAMWFVYYICSAWGDPLAMRTLADLARARSRAEAEAAWSAYERLRVARSACEIQLHERSVPAACYETLALESASGLVDARERDRRRQDLDRRCARAAQRLNVHAEDSGSVSGECARAVKEAREIQAYRAQDSEDWSGN
jgi:hypothetical protein